MKLLRHDGRSIAFRWGLESSGSKPPKSFGQSQIRDGRLIRTSKPQSVSWYVALLDAGTYRFWKVIFSMIYPLVN